MTKGSDARLSEATRAVYEAGAEAWDRTRGRGLSERPWLERFLALAPAGPILDLGCGAGEPIAAWLVGQGRAVTGVDFAAPLLDRARGRLPGEWILADMRGLDLGRRFAGILAWDSFFHLTPDDQRRMFAVFQNHAAPQAALMFTSGPAHGEAIGTFEGEPLYHASLAPQEYHALLDAHGFRVVRHVAEDPACNGHTVWLACRAD
jgi:SAM-dependent methyltransferase